MNRHERIFRDSLALSKYVEDNGITVKNRFKWRRLRRAIKRYKQLETPRQAPLWYNINNTVDVNDLPFDLSYYSDRWTRGRMYQIDAYFKE